MFRADMVDKMFGQLSVVLEGMKMACLVRLQTMMRIEV
jgi:hypothetical protein